MNPGSFPQIVHFGWCEGSFDLWCRPNKQTLVRLKTGVSVCSCGLSIKINALILLRGWIYVFLVCPIEEQFSSASSLSLVFIGALPLRTGSRYNRVTFRRFGSFYKVHCESEPNKMKVQQCCNFTTQMYGVPQTIVWKRSKTMASLTFFKTTRMSRLQDTWITSFTVLEAFSGFSVSSNVFLHLNLSHHSLQLFGTWLQRLFSVKLQQCFVD